MLAPWLGGASAPVPIAGTKAGFVSLLAPWLGGASAPTVPTPPTPPEPSGGGAGPIDLHWDEKERKEREPIRITVNDEADMLELSQLIYTILWHDKN
jgi:hypothetical protein